MANKQTAFFSALCVFNVAIGINSLYEFVGDKGHVDSLFAIETSRLSQTPLKTYSTMFQPRVNEFIHTLTTQRSRT